MYLKMQKLVKAARDGTKDGLEKTKAAVKRGRSFIKTKTHGHGKSRTWTFFLFVHISQLIICDELQALKIVKGNSSTNNV